MTYLSTLSEMTIGELADVCEGLRGCRAAMLALDDRNGRDDAAGDFARREGRRICDMLEDIEDELERRTPSNDSEALDRASALLRLRLDVATSVDDLEVSAVTPTCFAKAVTPAGLPCCGDMVVTRGSDQRAWRGSSVRFV